MAFRRGLEELRKYLPLPTTAEADLRAWKPAPPKLKKQPEEAETARERVADLVGVDEDRIGGEQLPNPSESRLQQEPAQPSSGTISEDRQSHEEGSGASERSAAGDERVAADKGAPPSTSTDIN